MKIPDWGCFILLKINHNVDMIRTMNWENEALLGKIFICLWITACCRYDKRVREGEVLAKETGTREAGLQARIDHLKVTDIYRFRTGLFCVPFLKRWRTALFVGPSVCTSVMKIHVAVTLPFLNSFFIKRLHYIAYDKMDTMMPNSLGQGHICWSFFLFCLLFLTKQPRATQVLKK